MLPFIDILTPTRSCPKRAIRWEPDTQTLTITAKKHQKYVLTETYPSPGYGTGRAFRLVKTDGTVYDLFCGPAGCSCDCPGFAYEATAKADRRAGDRFDTLGCVHLDAVRSLLEQGQLPDPRQNPDADVSNTEVEEPAETCGNCSGRGYYPGPAYSPFGYELNPRNLTCEYCGGSGSTPGGSRLLPHCFRGVGSAPGSCPF